MITSVAVPALYAKPKYRITSAARFSLAARAWITTWRVQSHRAFWGWENLQEFYDPGEAADMIAVMRHTNPQGSSTKS
jgi:hypothetical protein